MGERRSRMESIIVAALALIGTLAGAYLANRRTTALIVYRLEELEKKVERHNQVVERTMRLEAAQALLEEQVKTAGHRLDGMERRQELCRTCVGGERRRSARCGPWRRRRSVRSARRRCGGRWIGAWWPRRRRWRAC